MKPWIETLRITGYRGFREAGVDGLGQVNLITGRNGCGKSTLLEAIQLLVSGGALRAFCDVMKAREEFLDGSDMEIGEIGDCRGLFHGFPPMNQGRPEFSVRVSGAIPAALAEFKVRLYAQTSELGLPSPAFQDGAPMLEVLQGASPTLIPMARLSRRVPAVRPEKDSVALPCLHLDPCNSRSARQLAHLWDAIALTELEPEVVRALKLVVPDVQAVSMIGGPALRGLEREAIVKCARFPRPVPLKSFGDGVGRIFGIVLALCNVRGGVLLVDEVENGLHYSVQAELWSVIFRLAQTLSVQVFATTHSWDCVRAFQQAASDSPAQGVLTRLTRKDDRLHATTFTERELEIVTLDDIEVR